MTVCALPEDVKQICLWLVRGYERRKAAAQSSACLTVQEQERMEAVEQALVAVGADIPSEAVREQLRTAILLNVENERANPYHCMGLDAVGRAKFRRRRDRFLADIAVRLGMV